MGARWRGTDTRVIDLSRLSISRLEESVGWLGVNVKKKSLLSTGGVKRLRVRRVNVANNQDYGPSASGVRVQSHHAAANYEVETYSGRYVDVAYPKPETIALEDVAHGLAHTCRFGGQCFRFYSVAEHAVVVAQKLADEGADPMLVMAGLHHDDAEAYLGDIPRPMKRLLGEAYAEMTEDMDFAIFRALAWPDTDAESLLWQSADFKHEMVKAADEWALASEARMLLPSRGEGWQLAELKWPVGVGLPLFGLPPSIAKKQWLDFHARFALTVRPYSGDAA